MRSTGNEDVSDGQEGMPSKWLTLGKMYFMLVAHSNMWGRYHSHLVDYKTEAQRGSVICP